MSEFFSKKWLGILLVLLAQQGFAAPQYEYTKVSAAGRWKHCESTRDMAIRWAHTTAENDARDTCNRKGNGWRYSHREFKGYEQAIPCKGERKFKAEVTKATYVCKRVVKKSR